MPHIEKHKPGSFAWMELATADQNGAKQFYKSLFGWDFEDHPMGPGAVYTMFKLAGKDIAGCYPVSLMPGHVPPHWGAFIAVEDADRTAARATELGGKVLRAPGDVAEYGRMAVIQDPAGAVFSIWKPKSHAGTGITGENGALCWADLLTEDRERAKPFYEGLFGWRFDLGQGKDPSGYLHIKNGEDFIGGMQLKPPQAPPHWLLYFQTADCAASTAKAKQLGAKIFVEPMDIEGAGRFSVLDDPQGAGFALFQPKH